MLRRKTLIEGTNELVAFGSLLLLLQTFLGEFCESEVKLIGKLGLKEADSKMPFVTLGQRFYCLW